MPQCGDEVVHQPELSCLPVNVGRDKEQASLGTEHRVGWQQVLAGASFWTKHVGEAGRKAVQEDEKRAEQQGGGVHVCPSVF